MKLVSLHIARILVLVAAVCAPLSHAFADRMIEGAKECTRYFPQYERQNGIPVLLLSAIAATESGRWHDGLRIALPWPWTINVDGKGYYFNSKEEAIAAARRYKARGARNIDVGCMQVSMLHHAKAFDSLEDAFDPQKNVEYAARFLKNLYNEDRNWRVATASYHSKTSTFGNAYVGRVFDTWRTIITRVREARQQTAKADAPELAMAAQTAKQAQSYRNSRQYAALDVDAKKHYRPVGVKVIEVRTASVRADTSDVLVIRPAATPTVVTDASAVPTITPAAFTGGPRFIFSE